MYCFMLGKGFNGFDVSPSNTWDEASMILMIYYVLQASLRGLSFFNIGKCQLICFLEFHMEAELVVDLFLGYGQEIE